jgi:hypothetical protein
VKKSDERNSAMKMNRSYRFAAVCSALPLGEQTAAEELQKGIFTQETAGDPDGAIDIYRQIMNRGSTPREIAAQAQYRLGEALLKKGTCRAPQRNSTSCLEAIPITVQ